MSEMAQVGAVAELASVRETERKDHLSAAGLRASYAERVCARTHRLFVCFLLGQWAVCLALALGVPVLPRHDGLSVGMALGIGALLTLPTLLLIRWMPYAFATRLAVALAQMGFGVVAFHVAGGQVEAHFHIFGSLAFLSLYRDWRILAIAAACVLGHHLLISYWWPDLIAIHPDVTMWRLLEYGGWLVFASAALVASCLNARGEMREICQRQTENQRLLAELEQRVRDRTRALEAEMEARARTVEELQKNEQQHRDFVGRVPIGLFEITRSGAVCFANPYLLGLIGLPANFDPRGVSLADGRIFPTADHERFWHRLENEREVRGFATTLRHFDGATFEVVINAHVKPTPPGAELVCEGSVEDVTVRKRAERELEALHSQLVLASRQAGMAEVATGVLHNVGNVLTSVNLIVHDVQDRLKTTRLTHLQRVVDVLKREQPRLAEFLTADGAGKQLPGFLEKLNDHLAAENKQLLSDVEGLVRHFEHIREIIVTQQNSAQLFGVIESLAPAQLFEDALRLNQESLQRHAITIERLFEPVELVKADRHKVLQILVNLLKNAKDALQSVDPAQRLIRVRVAPAGENLIALSVQDNGPGIAPVNLTRIFQHGFTTKRDGHGFGLHSCVLAAREMDGDLAAASEGLGHGSTFTLTLPIVRKS